MNTRKKTKRREKKVIMERITWGFAISPSECISSLPFFKDWYAQEFIFLPFTEAFMMPLNPQIIFHRSFL